MFASKDVFLTPPATGGYTIGKSVRFRSSASAYLNRTPSVAGNQQIFTWSGWVKRGTLTSRQIVFGASDSSLNTETHWEFTSADQIRLTSYVSGTQLELITTPVYRDPSAWYHVVITMDTTQATASNRSKIYINGLQITALSTATYPTQNLNTQINNTISHGIGRAGAYASLYFDGYLTEINFIDGQALTPSSFGSTNAITGVWQPAKYTGTYGTNGFYLNFSSNGTAAALGTDFSGNSNTWTVNNISVTAGTTYDSMTDVPTLTSATAANYPTWNPLTAGGLVTFSEANLKALSTSSAAPSNIESTVKTATTGKWYAEITMAAGVSNPAVGIGNNPATSPSNTDQFACYRVNATYVTSGMGASSTGTPATFTTNDVIGVAYNADAGTLSFYKNGTLQTGGFTGITAGNYSFIVRKDSASGDGGFLNCGQRPFSYTPPTGYVALNTYNLPTSTITNGAAYMAATLWTGNGSTQSISNAVNGTSFQPDFVWVKDRSATNIENHWLTDSVRGNTKYLSSNLTDSEYTFTTDVTSFNSNGFSLGADGKVNRNADPYVGWQWKAGTTSSSNTNGSITSTVSAGATQGFSVVTYTGTGTAATIGHGLGIAPSMYIVKSRSLAGENWIVYHTSLGNAQQLNLNTTAAQAASTNFNSTSPTSSVFSIGSGTAVNSNTNTYVAYCFAAVKGFSAFGSYTGNGSADGTFVYTGFRPRWILIKVTNTTSSWFLFDSSRSTYNAVLNYLLPNDAGAAGDLSQGLDFLSNGFKLRDVGNGLNGSGNTYIYAAFAENPFKNSLAR